MTATTTNSTREVTVSNSTNPRRYIIGDIIPGHGLVIDIALTAYHISTP